MTTQREQCDRVRAGKGWAGDVIEYVDNDIASNGKTTRPGWNPLFADVRAGIVDKIVIAHQDRLTRWPRDGEDFLELIAQCGVTVGNDGGEVDLTTDSGRMIFRILCATARAEVERKGARQRAANQRRANGGSAWISAGRSFGYIGNAVEPVEAAAIAEACEYILNGGSLLALARQWNRDGLLTVKGKQWTGVTVRQVLRRPRNAGLAVYHGEILEGVEAAWPAIVSRDVWESTCSVLTDPARYPAASPAAPTCLAGWRHAAIVARVSER